MVLAEGLVEVRVAVLVAAAVELGKEWVAEEGVSKVTTMKIAFPVLAKNDLDSPLGDHFGRSPFFTIYDTETKTVVTIDNAAEHFGGVQSTPAFLKEHGVNVLVCKALGTKAIVLFDQFGIGVFLTRSLVVREALEGYSKNELKQATRTNGYSGNAEHHHHEHFP
ncbi:dinitrogenase iron-molybdenum cofactor biosynthesis protein [Candidatus Heimdallarchaeota archaeon]|nr:MAG: dinitrogenase iron-molybdenum cofactor biosynthesis protein [Candidatus Heimdallarchaeota archaeon]